MADRQSLHQLIEVLPESELEEAGRILQALCGNGEDVVTPENLAEIEQARAEIQRGEWVTLEQIKSENGL